MSSLLNITSEAFGLKRAINHLTPSAAVQPKLTVNTPGDRYEQEADSMADRVMRMAAPGAETKPLTGLIGRSVQRKCFSCEKEEEKKHILRKESGEGGGLSVSASFASSLNALKGGGSPLPRSTRSFMENAFSTDFSGVRVHADSRAAEMSRGIQAKAFTYGSDIYFNTSEYNTHTENGKRLLAHELSHTVQQGGIKRKMVQREVLYSNGYPRPYSSDLNEVTSAEKNTWTPSTIDFKASALASGGTNGVSDFNSFLNALSSKADNSITDLYLIGHSNSSMFSFGGRILVQSPPDVDFVTDDNCISTTQLSAKMDAIVPLRKKFAPGSSIVLVGCHAGTGVSLLDAISNAFQVCVKGFINEVIWCLNWSTPGKTITGRGKIGYVSPDTTDPLELILPVNSNTSDVKQLTPDNQSCAGVPQAAPVPSPSPAPRSYIDEAPK
ncbi:MAG: DUF4157 domain-containing protein [Bacteroidota bacterium]